MKSTHIQRSLMWSAVSLPLGLVAGKMVEAILKTTNPDHVDITVGLAYLAHIILTTLLFVLACWLMSVVSLFLAYKNDEEPKQVRSAAIVLAVVIALTVLGVVLNGITNRKIEQAKMQQQVNQQRKLPDPI